MRCIISLFKHDVLIYSEIVIPSAFARRRISLSILVFIRKVITLLLCRVSEPLRLFLTITMNLWFPRSGCRGLPWQEVFSYKRMYSRYDKYTSCPVFRYNFSAENKKLPHKLVSSIQKSKASRNIFYTGFKMVLVIFFIIFIWYYVSSLIVCGIYMLNNYLILAIVLFSVLTDAVNMLD